MTEMELRQIDPKEFYPLDMFQYSKQLTPGELTVLANLRDVLHGDILPVVDENWENATFPHEQFAKIVPLRLLDNPLLFEGRDVEQKLDSTFASALSPAYTVFRSLELAKADLSIATFFGVHSGLFLHSILQGGSPEQIERWAPKAINFEIQGCFGLTEPLHGSDVAGGLETIARKEGDKWVINGSKRWIGGASTADEMVIYARDADDGSVKGFMVPGKAPGVSVEVITGKIGLRLVQNGEITLKDVEVTEDRRLQKINHFRDVQKILGLTRAGVADLGAGLTMGATEHALTYVNNRDQFGKSIGSFQLVQEKLARMQANVVSTLGYSMGLAHLQDDGVFAEQNSSIAKMHNSLVARETVALAREVAGGNGIQLEHGVARFFVDGEVIYSYEGTHEINSLIVGRYLTGKSAFL